MTKVTITIEDNNYDGVCIKASGTEEGTTKAQQIGKIFLAMIREEGPASFIRKYQKELD